MMTRKLSIAALVCLDVCLLAAPPTAPLQSNTKTAADSVVTFNEIMFHPAGDNPALEWIEVYNQMSINIDLYNWRIEGGTEFQFPTNVVLNANSYIVVAADPQAMKSQFGRTNVVGPFTKRLSNAGETLRLRNNNRRLMDELSYSDQEPWPVGADGSGASLAKRDRFAASSPAVNWRTSAQMGGTPGVENFPASSGVAPTDTLVSGNSPSRWLAPSNNTLGLAWTAAAFDDTGWTEGKAALGYDITTTNAASVPSVARFYPFDGSLADASGSRLDAQNSGARFTNDVPPLIGAGQALFFDGVSNQVTIADTVNPTGYTMAAWVKVDKVRPSSLIVRTDGFGPRVDWSHQLRINEGGFFEHYIFDGVGRTVTATNVIVPGTWYHVAGTATNGGALLIYVNGQASGVGAKIGTLWSGGDQWQVGTDSGQSASFFAGTVDSLAIWSAPLDPGTIQRLAAGASPVGLQNYRAFISTDLQPALYQKSSAAFVRIPFGAQAAYDTLSLSLRYADGFVAFLNGVEILRRNAPQALGFDSRATLHRTVTEAAQQEIIDLTPYATRLIPGKNVLAFQLLNSAPDNPGILLNAELAGRQTLTGPEQFLAFNEVAAGDSTNFFVELKNAGTAAISTANCRITSSAGGSLTLRTNVLAPGALMAISGRDLGFAVQKGDRLFLMGPAGGLLDALEVKNRLRGKLDNDPTGPWRYPSAATPGSANQFTFHDEIVINEIMYNHAPLYRTPTNDFTENGEQWIELYNRSSRKVDLTGWRLDGEIKFGFPAGAFIEPDGYLVVAKDQQSLRAQYPGIQITGNFSGRLSHHAGLISLVDPNDNPANEVEYFNDHPWPSYANGGGSSLELRDPRSDNSRPESWAASIESSPSPWRHYTYRAKAVKPVYTPAIFYFHEFRMGLLGEGEALVDNVTVTERTTNNPPRQLIQNPDFTSGITAWRKLGTHSHSFIESDPGAATNNVLHLVATDGMSYMDNRLETTLKSAGVITPVVTGVEYEISFDAKWLSGSPQLHTELYYNKVTATTILEMPTRFGTPGRRNSTYLTNSGPTYTGLQHSPTIPKALEAVDVKIRAFDPDGVGSMKLKYAIGNGAFNTLDMTADPGDPSLFSAKIPGQANGSVILFYVEGADAPGAVSTYPRRGPASRALIKVDSTRIVAGKQTFRTIMTPADSSLLHANTNILSDDLLGCTAIHNEKDVYYDARIRLHGSMFSRDQPDLTGMSVKFQAGRSFRGSRESIIVRRRGMVETLVKHFLNEAGGVPANYDDVVYFVSHRTDNLGAARMNLANYDDTYVDSQFEGYNDGTVFKLEGIREFQDTTTHTAEGYKLPMPIGWIVGYDIANLGDDPEQYRWSIMIQSQHPRDDYSRIVKMGKTFSLSGAALQDAIPSVIDVDEWARLFALQTLLGIADIYGVENPHNFAFYVRPDDGRVVGLQNDWEFAFSSGSTSIYGVQNVFKVLRLPPFRRLYQGHMLDLINTVCSRDYVTTWSKHIGAVTGEGYTSVPSYMNSRVTVMKRGLAAQIPFEITTPGGTNMTVDTSTVLLEGKAWIDAWQIYREGDDAPLRITWIDDVRWQTAVPLLRGTNTIHLIARNFRGASVGDATIAVASTLPFAHRDHLRISELMYHPGPPSAKEAAAGFTDADAFEFIELANIGPDAIPLNGVKFTMGVTFDFSGAAITNLAPSARLLVVKNKAAFELRYGTNMPIAGEYIGTLSNDGETIRLEDADGITIEQFTYSDSGEWPGDADGGGKSLQAINLAGDFTIAANWRASSTLGGTPGADEATLSFLPVGIAGGNVHLRFQAEAGKGYTLYRADSLPGAWQTLKQYPAGTARVEEMLEQPSIRQRYYKLSSP